MLIAQDKPPFGLWLSASFPYLLAGDQIEIVLVNLRHWYNMVILTICLMRK